MNTNTTHRQDKSHVKINSIHKQKFLFPHHKFGHTNLKYFIVILGILMGGGIIVQALHAPPTRILYWRDETCYSALKLNPSGVDSTRAPIPSSLFIFNNLGFPAESGKALGNYFAGRGMSVFLFDYFASPLTMDPLFNITRYFLQFAQELITTRQINASDIYFVGFGLGATCAFTLAEFLPPRAIVAVNAVSNFSRVMSWINHSPLDSLEVAQSGHWGIQLQNYGCKDYFKGLDGWQLDQLIPTLHTFRSQANSTLLVRTSGDPACIPLDQDELRERLHCETWVMAGDGNTALLDAQFHAEVADWLQGQGLFLGNPEQPITFWTIVTYVPAIGILLGIVGILMIRYLKINREDQDSLFHDGRPRGWEIVMLATSVVGGISLIFTWGNLQAAIEISGGIVGVQLVSCYICWKQGKFTLNKRKFEVPKTPWRDALVTVGIYGALLILSLTLFEPVIVPRGRNIPFLLLLGGEWGGLYLVNLASSEGFIVHNGNQKSIMLGIGPKVFGSILFVEEFLVLYNPLLLKEYPAIIGLFATFIIFLFNLPKFATKREHMSLFLMIGLTCALF